MLPNQLRVRAWLTCFVIICITFLGWKSLGAARWPLVLAILYWIVQGTVLPILQREWKLRYGGRAEGKTRLRLLILLGILLILAGAYYLDWSANQHIQSVDDTLPELSRSTDSLVSREVLRQNFRARFGEDLIPGSDTNQDLYIRKGVFRRYVIQFEYREVEGELGFSNWTVRSEYRWPGTPQGDFTLWELGIVGFLLVAFMVAFVGALTDRQKQSRPTIPEAEPASPISRPDEKNAEWISSWLHGELVACALIAFLAPLLYAWITDHIWEDYFITFRHSRNLVRGEGLVFNPGERVHGFTSPLGVLLPALFDWVFQAESYRPALLAFRLVSALAFALGAVLAVLALRAAGMPWPVRFLFLLLFVAEPKAVGFAANGMETAFLVLFLCWSFYLLVQGATKPWSLGLAWAGLMWTRPDGCVYVLAIVVATVMFSESSWRSVMKGLGKAGLCCALLYAPWLVIAWSYYGSPVPHTVLAKSVYRMPFEWTKFLDVFLDKAKDPFMPTYYRLGGWPEWLANFASLVGVFAALYWLLPTRDRIGRSASLVFALLLGYFVVLDNVAPWYLPPAGICGFLTLAAALGTFTARADVPKFATIAVGALVVGVTWVTLFLAVNQLRVQQEQIEFGTRMRVGEYLADKVAPGETVFLESLGYIGYFSNAHVDDYPGLVSPRVARLSRQRYSMYGILHEIKPEWIVLRPSERSSDERIDQDYQLMQTFDARPQLESYPDLFGMPYLSYDSVFHVMRRTKGASGK